MLKCKKTKLQLPEVLL